MKVRNLRSYAVSIPVEGGEIVAEPGVDVDVPDEIGDGLIAQVDVWEQVSNKGRKAASAGDGEGEEQS